MNASAESLESAWPHRLALLLVGVTFPLIWVGGLVTTYDAGMAVPDWPSTYGYNMFLYPWQTWIHGPWDLFIEHGHRLLGAAVGMVTIGFVASAWLADRRRWLRWLSLGALAAVLVQGSLGGLRVIEDKVELARVHGCVAPAFFALAVAIEVVTSRLWRGCATPRQAAGAARLQRLAIFTMLLAYAQIVLGSFLRHVPTGAAPGFFRTMVVYHLLVALGLAAHVALLAARVGRLFRNEPALVWPTVRLSVLTLVQLGIGLGTWITKYGWPTWLGSGDTMVNYTVRAEGTAQVLFATAHVALGAVILATTLVIVLRSRRLLVDVPRAAATMSGLPMELAR